MQSELSEQEPRSLYFNLQGNSCTLSCSWSHSSKNLTEPKLFAMGSGPSRQKGIFMVWLFLPWTKIRELMASVQKVILAKFKIQVCNNPNDPLSRSKHFTFSLPFCPKLRWEQGVVGVGMRIGLERGCRSKLRITCHLKSEIQLKHSVFYTGSHSGNSL